MRILIHVILAFVSVAQASDLRGTRKIFEVNDDQANIINGEEADEGEYPSYGIPHPFSFCGATLIAPDIMLTAAHCQGKFIDRNVSIGGIIWTGSDAGDSAIVVEERPHPDFTGFAGWRSHDIMLIKLDRSSTQPIRRYNIIENLPEDNEEVTMIGFGKTSYDALFPFSGYLLEKEIEVIPLDTCKDIYFWGGIESGVHICVHKNGGDACRGDDGGPLFDSRGKIVGVLCQEIECGESNLPAKYTNVSAYKDWIYQEICNMSSLGCQATDPCQPEPCLNGGVCIDQGDSFSCNCTSDWTNTTCNQEVVEPCDPNPCQNGNCTEVSDDEYNCTCAIGWEGTDCEIPTPCDPDPCQNQAICIPGEGTDYTCDCADFWTGMNCTTPAPCDPDPCVNSTCSVIAGTTRFCICEEGWTGALCDEEVITPCIPNPCLNGGDCSEVSGGNFECTCADYWNGTNCEEPTPCDPDDRCDNNSTCIVGDGIEFTCDCLDFWGGETCKEPAPCDPNPCQNGNCTVSGGTSHVCICEDGWTGSECQTEVQNPCDPNPCLNQGNCIQGTGTAFICNCTGGWRGTTCEFPHQCLPNPCMNDGICATDETNSSFSCTCADFWDGPTCEISTPCDPNPCANGGTCAISNGTDRVCVCLNGWTGDLCNESAPNPCEPNPCLNGGTCGINGDTFVCSCPDGFEGADCSTEVQVTVTSVETCGPLGINFLCWFWCGWIGKLLGLCNLS